MHRLDLLRCVGLLLLLARPVTILMVELPMLPAAVAAEAPQPAEDFVDEEAKQHRDQEDERRRESEKEQPLLHHLELSDNALTGTLPAGLSSLPLVLLTVKTLLATQFVTTVLKLVLSSYSDYK